MAVTLLTEALKVCRRCELALPLDAFGRLHHAPDGHRSTCKACRNEQTRIRYEADPELSRWRIVRHRYGIEKADYLAILQAQENRCAICRSEGTVRNGVGERYPLHIDHDHETGVIRGLLCYRCNNGIGLLGDPAALRAAADYLEGGWKPS